MKKITSSILLLFILYAYSGRLYSQNKYTEQYGVVTQHEMTMTEYEDDKEAEALIIYDLGSNYFRSDDRRGFLLNKERRFKIKILKQAGIDYANIEIPYYVDNNHSGYEEIEEIEAYTYNFEDGKLSKTKFDTKKIYEEKINEKWNVKKFAMPDVREGSVVEVKYKIITPFIFNMGEWDFQRKIPVIHSQLNYRAIPYYEYTYIARGIGKFDEYFSKALNNEIRVGNLVYKEVEYIMGMNNIPAFKDEEFISSPKNHMMSLNFQLSKIYYPNGTNKQIMTTWADMAKDFMKDDHFGKYMKNARKESKKIFPEIDLADKSQLEQVKSITSYVKKMYNWNHFSDKYAIISLSDFLKQKKGNSANINLFMAGLMQGAGIDANPVVLSTRNHSAISKDHPFTTFLNYVIVEVTIDGNKYYIDATEPLLDFDELPERCIHVDGLAIKNDGKEIEWIITLQETPAVTEKKLQITPIPKDRKIEVEAEYISSGYSAYNYRSIYSGKSENIKNHLQKRNEIDTKGDIEVIDKDLSSPFSFTFSFDTSMESTPDKLFINPFCNLAISDNPFKQTKRTLPVDLLYFRGEIYKATIDIPEGYKVEFIPRASSINNKILTLNYAAIEKDNKIEVSAGYRLNKNVYSADEYIVLKSIFTSMIERFSDMIVLVKTQE